MKLTVAATIISSSALATAEILTSPAGESLQNAVAASSQRSLASENRQDIAAVLKSRRASKRQNGKVFRKLQNKLKNSKLRNEAQEYGGVSDVDMDLGFFSRSLQTSNITEPEEATIIDDLLDLCAGEDEVEGFSCACSNVDVDAYTANVVCTYDSTCTEPTPNACGEYAAFCFVETYELDVSGPGQGSSQICYEVTAPTEFSYCYGLMYADDTGTPDSCFLKVDETQCNMCEFATLPSDPNSTCTQFDCSNVDDSIASGTVCGDDSIVVLKIEDYLLYGPLPCEDGCNICPYNGEMMNLKNGVTMITGEQYSCAQLNLAGLMGYFQNVPGDLCSNLPPLVKEPCECTVPIVETPTAETPITVSDEEETENEISPEDSPGVEEVISETNEDDASGSAALSLGLNKLTFVAAVGSLFSKMVL